LKNNVPISLHKLEKNIYCKKYFDSKHLAILLAYEALVGESIQFKWMYLFERFVNHLI